MEQNPWHTAYDTWKATPDDPAALNNVVQTLTPTIDGALARMNAQGDPLLKAKSRTLAAKAIKTFDPTQATSLPTWVTHQLNELHRFRRITGQVLKVPEGHQLDAMRLHRARQTLIDRLGREPELPELADEAKLSIKRISAVNKSQFSTPADASFESGEAIAGIPQSSTDFGEEAIAAIYRDADSVDRAIMEGKMGYGGKPPVSTLTLLQRTKLSPFQLSRRSVALTNNITRLQQKLEGAYTS